MIADQMHAFAGRDSIKPEVELLTTPGERRVIGRGEFEAIIPKSDCTPAGSQLAIASGDTHR